MSDSNVFLISWDQLGVEAVVNISKLDQERMWAVLADEDTSGHNDVGSVYKMLELRARFNPQRHYEIYSLNVADGITEADIKQMFENDPQGTADLVRSRGTKHYSDRANPSTVKIT